MKDFSSISPSAKSLLMMKGYTNIPYARQLTALLEGDEIFHLDFNNKDFWFWLRVMHFESRYWSIDQLLKDTENSNILELSSGFSLRGLDYCINHAGIHYIDTDLPEVINVKDQLITKLHSNDEVKGKLELLPLNVMDEVSLNSIVNRFSGPVTIVNEGLLMYLADSEKKELCSNLQKILKERGGCWITADIYLMRSEDERGSVPYTRSENEFFEKHRIEENKFESFDSAEAFFKDWGFEVVKEAKINYHDLSALPYLLKVLPEEARNSKEPPPKIQATWMLRPI